MQINSKYVPYFRKGKVLIAVSIAAIALANTWEFLALSFFWVFPIAELQEKAKEPIVSLTLLDLSTFAYCFSMGILLFYWGKVFIECVCEWADVNWNNKSQNGFDDEDNY